MFGLKICENGTEITCTVTSGIMKLVPVSLPLAFITLLSVWGQVCSDTCEGFWLTSWWGAPERTIYFVLIFSFSKYSTEMEITWQIKMLAVSRVVWWVWFSLLISDMLTVGLNFGDLGYLWIPNWKAFSIQAHLYCTQINTCMTCWCILYIQYVVRQPDLLVKQILLVQRITGCIYTCTLTTFKGFI